MLDIETRRTITKYLDERTDHEVPLFLSNRHKRISEPIEKALFTKGASIIIARLGSLFFELFKFFPGKTGMPVDR